MPITAEQLTNLQWFAGAPTAPPQEPVDDPRVADLEQRILALKKDLRDRNATVAALEKQLRTLPPADGHLARNEAEARFCEEAERHGWRPTRAGAPDYFCLAHDGTIALVIVMPNAKSRLRREQLRVMKSLASYGVPCFRWCPATGFERFRGGSMKVLEFLRRTRRMSQTMLAEAVDVPQEVISQIERGSVRPKPENLERIAALLLPPGQDPVGLLREVPGSLANVLLQGTPARPTVPAAAGAVSAVP